MVLPQDPSTNAHLRDRTEGARVPRVLAARKDHGAELRVDAVDGHGLELRQLGRDLGDHGLDAVLGC